MIQRGDAFLHAHAAGGAQGRYYRRCDTGNHLHDELQGFLLCHSLNLLIFNFQLSIFNWIGAFAPNP